MKSWWKTPQSGNMQGNCQGADGGLIDGSWRMPKVRRIFRGNGNCGNKMSSRPKAKIKLPPQDRETEKTEQSLGLDFIRVINFSVEICFNNIINVRKSRVNQSGQGTTTTPRGPEGEQKNAASHPVSVLSPLAVSLMWTLFEKATK